LENSNNISIAPTLASFYAAVEAASYIRRVRCTTLYQSWRICLQTRRRQNFTFRYYIIGKTLYSCNRLPPTLFQQIISVVAWWFWYDCCDDNAQVTMNSVWLYLLFAFSILASVLSFFFVCFNCLCHSVRTSCWNKRLLTYLLTYLLT